MTQTFDLLTDYLNRGMELDLVEIQNDCRIREDLEARDLLIQKRDAEADRLLPIVGDIFVQADLPRHFAEQKRDRIVSRFSIVERKQIARSAIALEITPAQIYWKETANDLLPLLETVGSSLLTRSDPSRDLTLNQKADLAALISKRNRDIDLLRGDPDAMDSFGALLTTPQANLPRSAAMTLASHLVSHTRINRRSERQFDYLQPLLPEESTRICRAVRESGLVPEIVLQANAIRNMTDRNLERSVFDAQDDVLACAKENAAKGLFRGSDVTHLTRITCRDRISALRLMAEQSRSFGVFSPQVDQVSRKIFELGEVTGLAEVALVAPEAIRRERVLHREGLRDIVTTQEAAKGTERSAR